MTLESLRVDGVPVDGSHAPLRTRAGQGEQRESIGDLFSRAVADGKGYVTSQVEVVKQTALTGVEKGGVGVGLIAGAGFLAYVFIKVVLGKAREVHPLMYVVAALFVVYFAIDPIEAALTG